MSQEAEKTDELDYVLNNLIEKAIDGDVQSAHELANKVTLRLRTYIYRSTLDDDITDDVLQETMLIFLKKIHTLKEPKAFWGWLFRIASNSVISYYRKKSKHKKVLSFQDMLIEKAVAGDSPDSRLMNRELTDTIKQAVSSLNPSQRQAISLRCFENMSFREIGSVLEISELSARVTFHRALQAMKRSLKVQGFTGSSLLLALVFFGKVTSSSHATASTVSVPASIITGAGSGMPVLNSFAKIYAAITAKIGKIAAVVIVAAAVGIGIADLLIGRDSVSSVHYSLLGLDYADENIEIVRPGLDPVTSVPIDMDQVKSNIDYKAKGMYEQKVVFPEGPDGPMLRYMLRIGMDGEPLCRWLQDGSANYYYESGADELFITNDPLRMLVLPCDKPSVANFIASSIGRDKRVQKKRGFFDECLFYLNDNRAIDYQNVETRYDYNTLTKESLAAEWPESFSAVYDQRDQMHKRGWTYYTVSGELYGKQVRGYGRVPFVYDKYQEYQPWCYLEIGEDKLIDYTDGQPSELTIGGKTRYLPDDAVYYCLPRQWSGFAFIDSLCRDAAEREIYFEIKVDTDTDGQVILYPYGRFRKPTFVFDINRYDDLIRSIEIRNEDIVYGKITYNYYQETEGKESSFPMPIPEKTEGIKVKASDGYWLQQIVDNINGR